MIIVNVDLKFTCKSFKYTAFSHPSTTITRVRQEAQKMLEAQKDNPLQGSGSALLDTYLQFITENSFGE